MKKIASFLNCGWFNFVFGLCIFCGSVYLILSYQDSLDRLSIVFGFVLWFSSDIMGYGFTKILSGIRNKKAGQSSDDSSR